MARVTVPLAILVLTLTACHEVPKPEPRARFVAKVEWAEDGGRPEGIQRCAIDGQDCHPLIRDAVVELPGRVVTGGGARAAIRLDADAMLTVGEDAVVLLPDTTSRTVAVERGSLSLEQTTGGVTELVAADHQIEVEGRSAVAIRAQSFQHATVTVHRGAASVFGEEDATIVRKGQTVVLAAERPVDQRAVFAGRAVPVSLARAGKLVPPVLAGEAWGFGRVTARVPGTEQVAPGVRLRKHQVRTVIKDGFARTEVEEELFNDTARVLEGRYVFALPPGASLSRLALWVGDRLVEGEIVERDRGARIFRGIVDDTVRPRDPALLEWVGGSELSLKIFPIEPKRGRRVLLAYNEALPSEGRTMRYRYPLGLGRDRTTKIDEFSLTVTAYDSRGPLRDVVTRGYAAVTTGREGGITTQFAAQGFAPVDDFVVEYPLPEAAAPLGLFVPDWGSAEPELPEVAAGDQDASYFALPLTVELPGGTLLPVLTAQDRVVVVDRSFSQGEESLGAQVRIARALLEDLDPGERFAVLACDSACDAYPAQRLAEATAEHIAKAKAWLDGAAIPMGASDLAGGVVAAAARLETNGWGQVVVLGDGRATAGELGADAVAGRIRPFLGSRRVDLRFLGVGRSVDEVLLRGLASAVGAAYERVATEASLEDRIAALVLGLRTPVVEAPVLELPAQYLDVHPRRLPNLRLGQTLLVTGKLREAQLGAVTLRGTLAGEPYRFARMLGDADRARQNPLVPRLWAEQAIAELDAQGPEAPVEQIVRLSRRHHVLSRQTSLLVLENARMFAEFGVRRTQGLDASQPATPEVTERVDRWGTEIGDHFGAGGIGLTGIGSGGHGAGIGLGSIGSYGRAAGPGSGQGFGYGSGRLGGSHVTRAPKLRMGASVVSGRLPPEVIQRIVRQSYGRFRICYEQGLARNPDLAGRVTVRFVIGREGTVLNATNGGSDLPDSVVASCVVQGFYGLTFPEPEGGVVTVVYPIGFEPGGLSPTSSRSSSASEPSTSHFRRFVTPRRVAPATHQPGSERWRELGGAELARAREAVQKRPESRRVWAELLTALLRHGRFEDAHREGRALVRRDPDDVAAHEGLAWAAAACGEGVEAARALATAAELDPRRVTAQLAAARAFEAAGDETRACAHWRAAATLEAKPGRARFEALRCRARLGEFQAARAELAIYADDPGLEPLRAALVAGEAPAHDPTRDPPGWFEARVDCTAGGKKCPVPAIVTPQGRVVSPYSPELARASAVRVALARTSTGRYRTLLVGGDRGAEGKLTLIVHGAAYSRPFRHEGGTVTAVESDVHQ
ncbi:MAG: AgmX/PglI C-terminal domain-containing protein [Polyangiaceae bacterium]|nr:AgmX/PglI C-terminal domain-containing protein [Polyangiaceae bacterium]